MLKRLSRNFDKNIFSVRVLLFVHQSTDNKRVSQVLQHLDVTLTTLAFWKVNMAEYSISEILSFLNPARKSPGYFPIESHRLTQGVSLGMVCAHGKNRSLSADQKKIRKFRKKHPVHALMRHRAGDPSPRAHGRCGFFKPNTRRSAPCNPKKSTMISNRLITPRKLPICFSNNLPCFCPNTCSGRTAVLSI